MNSADKRTRRDIGLADERYLKPGEFAWRRQLADKVRELANGNDSSWRNSGWMKFVVRSKRLRKQADRLEICGSQYRKTVCQGCNQVIVGRRRCEVRICPHCMKKYRGKVQRRQAELVRQFPQRKNMRWMLFTATRWRHPLYRPTTADAQQTFRMLRKLLNEFYPRKSGCGALAVLELGSKGHLHIHVILYGHYVDQKVLSQRWHELTGDSPVVHIEAIREHRKCLNYVLKYLTKQTAEAPEGQDTSPDQDKLLDAAQLLDLFLGMRRIRTYGVFYNFALSSKISCPCPLCGGKLLFGGFEEGRLVPSGALFFEEAQELVKKGKN